MKKALVTFDINYDKRITDITIPFMENYSKKIGAEFIVIKEKKINQPVICEKFQLYELSKNYDWTICIDCDALIHPNCPDFTEIVGKETVIFNSVDFYPIRFKHNNYTRRDGRNIGASPWLTIFSDWNRHLWEPFDNPEKYLDDINLTVRERNFGYKPEHILSDYLVSRNIAKYGLKVKTIFKDLLDSFPSHPSKGIPLFFLHEYCITQDQKIDFLNFWKDKIESSSHFYDNQIDKLT